MTLSWQVILDAIPALTLGTLFTLRIVSIALIIAVFIGLLTGLMTISKSKLLNWIAASYINVFRGTPLLVQIFFIYFGLPTLGIKIPAEMAGILAISLNAGAYIAEIFRAGINSINKGQTEASRSLGLTRFQTLRLVILPQAIRRMIPAFVNQFIISIKDTSLLSVIGIRELMQSGEIIVSTTYRAFEIWALVGAYYFVIIYVLTRLSRMLERRLASK